MFEQGVRTVSETLARNIDRRAFLRQMGTVLASGVTALAMGQLLANSSASADVKHGTLLPEQPSCAPPGPYCNIGTGILSGCHGAHCFEHLYNGQVISCQAWNCCYQIGCWTTSVTGGYWTCCDCSCGDPQVTTCGCAQFSGTPATLAE